jgi:soluble lytic murein transglycosylase-like protein
MTILPQFQGDAYTLQNKAALAQALMQQSFQPQNTQAVGSGQYTVVPKYSGLGGLAQLGQALVAARMQNDVAQGYQGLGQNQWAALTGSPASGGMGGASAGSSASGSPPQALADALGGGGSSAPQQLAPMAPGGSLNPNGVPTNTAAMAYLNPATQGEYMKSVLGAYAPTDASRMARQGNMDPIAANQGALFKNNYVAPNQFGANTVVQDPRTGAMSTTPSAAPAGYQNIQSTDGKWYTIPVQGGTAAVAGNAAATAAGEGSQLPYAGLDASGNPLPVTNRTAAATQAGATTPASAAIVHTESNGNPNAVSPKGAMGAWQVMPNTKTDPGFGVTPAANNSPAELNRVGRDYYNAMVNKYQNPTLGAIAYNMGPGATDQWIKNGAQFEKLPAETRAYVGKVATLTALNSGAGAAPSAPAKPAGIYAAAPMGAQANAEATAKGQVDTMQKSYQNLQTVRSGAPAALQDVDNMMKLAQGASPATIGPAGAKLAGLFSANAAEYEKSRDNLVTNLGSQLGINSDAARDLVYGSIPSYGAPKQAVQNGLDTLRGQIQTRLLKSDYLSDAYSSGDAKTYNQRENQFDQKITPAIANVVAMPAGPERAAALQSVAKNPAMRARLEWAAQNGILK